MIKLIIQKHYILLGLIIFIILRLIYVYFAGWREVVSGTDATTYDGYAQAILQSSDWLTNTNFKGYYRAPVYPLFLAIIYFIFGNHNFLAVYFFQSVLGILSVLYIFKLSSLIFTKKRSILAFVWSGLYYWYLFYSGKLLRETLVFFLIIFTFYYLWKFLENEKRRPIFYRKSFWMFVLSFFILIHTDPKFVFYIPFLLVLFLIYNKPKFALQKYLSFIMILMVLCIPWTIRNYIAYNGLVIINTRLLDLRKGTESYVAKVTDIHKERRTKIYSINYPTLEERKLIKAGKNPNNRSAKEVEAIKNDIFPTKSYIGREWFYFRNLWSPYHFKNEYRPWPDCRFSESSYPYLHKGIGKLFVYGTLLPFMIFTFFYLIKRKRREIYFLYFPIIIHTFLHMITWSQPRYRMHIDSFVIITGCYGITIAISYFHERLKQRLQDQSR